MLISSMHLCISLVRRMSVESEGWIQAAATCILMQALPRLFDEEQKRGAFSFNTQDAAFWHRLLSRDRASNIKDTLVSQ